MKNKLSIGFFSMFIVFQSNVNADKLLIEAVSSEPPNSIEGIPRPKPGMQAQRVKAIFGEPVSVSNPVGRPAIVRWQYEKFEVVFEENTVINTVLKTPNEILVSDE